jgi:hypothetical protein
VDQQIEHLVADAPLDFEAHRPAEPAATQFHLDRGEQVVGLLLFQGEVGVARDPEEGVLLDDHPHEHRRKIGGDHLLG